MDARTRGFVERSHDAVMITLKKDGMPHAVRIGVGLVDGRLWSSGTRDRARTKHLRRDPRAALFLMGDDRWHWLTLETTVRVLDDQDAVENNLALYRSITGKEPDDLDEYRSAMVSEGRLIYEFEVLRSYGMTD